MKKPATLSPLSAVYKTYPDAFYNFENAIVRVQSIDNHSGESKSLMSAFILEKVARRITQERQLIEQHRVEAERRRVKRGRANTPQRDGEDADELLDGIFGTDFSLDEGGVEPPEALNTSAIKASRLSFIPLNEDATIRTSVFPRTFHCTNCNHFEAIDPERPPATLLCPCCKKSRMTQEPIVFECARCATVRELSPKGARGDTPEKRRKPRAVDDFLGGPPSCPDCERGHIHLVKHRQNKMLSWTWECQSCKSYREEAEELCLSCVLAKTDDDTGSMVKMNGFPATAPGALQPLVDVSMFVGEEPLDPRTLHFVAQETGRAWGDYFELTDEQSRGAELGADDLKRINDACIANAYLFDKLSVVKTVFGYRAGNVAAHSITVVEEQDRQARFFPDPHRFVEYLTFGMTHKGAALAIEFDRERILERLSQPGFDPSLARMAYKQAVERTRNVLASTSLRNLLHTNEPQLILYRAMHAAEHALLASAQRVIGSEVLGSTLFFEEGILLIYEREAVGRGGVVQLVNRGRGLVKLLDAVADQVSGCAQGCADGCPSCIYLRDIHCHYNLDELGRTWLPSNVLLSRGGARQLIAPNANL
jgi:ssDNA-binding Zn-finger/Zn-ribbon topoisomerase 1